MDAFFSVLFLKEKNQKNFLWGLVKGFDLTRDNIPYESLSYCSQSNISDC